MKPIVPIVLALTLLSTGCRTAPADTPPAAPVVPAATMRVHARDWPSTFEAGGIVRARVTADIASRVMASVISVHGRPGDRVTRGTPLVTLDARELTAAERHADAMSDASAQQTRAAEGAVRAADAAVTLAETTYDRIRSLHDRRSATPQELDRATAALDAARAQRTSAQATLDATIASRTAATAAVDAAAIARSYTTLTAPFDGIITTRAIEPGDMATPGVRLLTLEDTTGARLEVTLDEARAARIAVSRTAHILLGNAPDAAWVDATVSEIAQLDPASHSRVVKLDLPATVHAPSGAFGRARFDGPSRQTLAVPISARVRRGQLTFVYTVDRDNRARLQPISPGDTAGDLLEVLAGLNADDRIVQQPPASLTDGARIAEASR